MELNCEKFHKKIQISDENDNKVGRALNSSFWDVRQKDLRGYQIEWWDINNEIFLQHNKWSADSSD